MNAMALKQVNKRVFLMFLSVFISVHCSPQLGSLITPCVITQTLTLCL